MHSNAYVCNVVVLHHNHENCFRVKRLSILKITNMAEVRNSEGYALVVSCSLLTYIAQLESYMCERHVLMCNSCLQSI